MRVGEYTLTEFLGSHHLFTSHRARHSQTNKPAEVRLLAPVSRSISSDLENQLRRLAWVQSDFVSKPLSYELVGDTPYVAFDETTPISPALSIGELQQFVYNATSALQAIHAVGLCVGPFDWRVFSSDGDGNIRLDASGLMTHLTRTADNVLSLAEFPFAAPETISGGYCDPISDCCSWGLFLRSLLPAPVATHSGDLTANEGSDSSSTRLTQLWTVIERLTLTDPAERATLAELLGLFAEATSQTSVTFALDNGNASRDLAFSAAEGTLAVDVDSSIHTANVPTQLGRFKIEAKLGEGGMGAVYRARDLAGEQIVALKVLGHALSSNPRAVRRFAKEARLLAMARSPYVANLLEAHTESDTCYLVSEFVEGGSLGAWLQADEPLNYQWALSLLVDIARGLALAHDRGIVHRDLKPDNILLTRRGREYLDQWRERKSEPVNVPAGSEVLAKLADFGIARTEHQSESLAMTAENALLGTPLYMAPEQCLGSRVDPRADVYSLGVTLFKMLAGCTPFTAESNLQLMTMHANDAPPSLRQYAPDVPEAVTQVIEKCLAKNPEARYNHARELLVDLENILRGQPTGIGLHPALINQNVENVLTFEHTWDLRSTREQLWPYVAHTDRVNHAMGLSTVDYVTQSDPVMGVMRMAETTVAGQKLRWREHPYEWVEGKRLSVLREFVQGPFEWFANIVELIDRSGNGTTVRQTLKVKPRSWLGKALAKFQLGNKSRKAFGRVYAEIDRFIQAEAASKGQLSLAEDPWGNRFQMAHTQSSKLKSRLAAIGTSPATRMLAELIEHASDLDIARIRPYALADRFQLSRNDVLDTCLRATREGVLLLLWDILCPSCRIPSDVVDTLTALKDHAHCQACNLEFELDFNRSIEMIFRAHPELRAAETRTYCIGGPAWSRHVVAQVRLAQGERFVCDVELEPGAYTVRGPQLPFSVPFRVSPTAIEPRLEVSLGRAPEVEQPRLLGNERQAIWLNNDTQRDLEIRIERTASRQDAVTAAAAASSALFRELFGDQVLAGGQLISVSHITYLLVKLFGAGDLYRQLGDAPAFSRIREQLSIVETAVKHHNGAVVKTIGETVVATFPTQVAAFDCALLLCSQARDDELQLGCVLHSGPAVVATLDDRLDYFGQLVHESLSFLELCQPGGILTLAQTLASIDLQGRVTVLGGRLKAIEHGEYALVHWSANAQP